MSFSCLYLVRLRSESAVLLIGRYAISLMSRTAAWKKEEQKSLFDDQFSSQHPHLALEAIFAGLIGGELQGHLLTLR